MGCNIKDLVKTVILKWQEKKYKEYVVLWKQDVVLKKKTATREPFQCV